MRFSRSFPASPQCLASPDGGYVATLSASTLHVREVGSLDTVRETTLPRAVAGPVMFFQWSPSSRMLLIASVDEIHVFSAREEDDLHATVRSLVPPAAKLVYAGFGAADTDVCVCASLGLKFAIFDIKSSRVVEIANPKFHTAATVRKGFCFRPETRHLAVLSRTSGKDMISIHNPQTKALQRSWSPDTIDAQGIVWSADGKWLVAWESAAHGHKVLFYTPDGNLLKTWSGPRALVPTDAEAKLGPGVRLLALSPDARCLAIGDSSRRICMMNMAYVTESLRLQHPNNLVPTDSLQVWQEQVSNLGHQFVRALQTIHPPTDHSGAAIPSSSGCTFMSFDSSSVLLATKLEDAPSTVWIWDVAGAELRAVLVFHGKVSRVLWHPSIRETLLVTCDGDSYNSLVFLWDPLSGGPKPVDFSEHMANGNFQAVWLNVPALEPASLFVCDGREYLFASLAEHDGGPVPWSADAEISNLEDDVQSLGAADIYDEEACELDDTFCFKR